MREKREKREDHRTKGKRGRKRVEKRAIGVKKRENILVLFSCLI